MMEEKSKIKVIADAFTEALPVGEQWYEDRLKICATCPYNSKNVDGKGLLLKIKDIAGASCTACGCFIERKASRKEEECGLSEINMTPKWNKLAVITSSAKDYNMYNNTPEKARMYIENNEYILDYGDINKSFDTKLQVVLEGESNIVSTNVSCGCTTPNLKRLKKGLTQLDIKLNLSNIRGKASKTITCNMEDGKRVVIRLKLIVK